MKSTTLFAILFFFLIYSVELFAGDAYAEYKMKSAGNRVTTSAMYFKNGDLRTEVKMDIAGKEMTAVTLNLKSNPEYTLSYNSHSKTYTELKKNNSSDKTGKVSITVIGSEKIGAYNCKHVRMTSDTNSWDMWVTKDLPAFDFPLQKDDDVANRKMMELLKSKSADGVPVKIEFKKPNAITPGITMELVKFESKSLDASLFKIPDGYTKSTVQFDAEKMKSMSPEEKRQMIKKMMEENMPKK
jgi:hypothetical protein